MPTIRTILVRAHVGFRQADPLFASNHQNNQLKQHAHATAAILKQVS